MFNKLFELNQEYVEDFIKKEAIKYIGNPEPNKEQFNIHYYPFNDEIMVNMEPIKYWKDLAENGMTLKEYCAITVNHCHFTFQEIYGKLTGKTVYNGSVSVYDDEINETIKGYLFIYNKKEITIIKKNNEWKSIQWMDVGILKKVKLIYM